MLRCPKISLCRIFECVIFFSLNLHTSEVFLAIWGVCLIGFCVFSVLIFIADFDGFFSFMNIQIFLPDRKTCFFRSVSGFPPVASAAAFSPQSGQRSSSP